MRRTWNATLFPLLGTAVLSAACSDAGTLTISGCTVSQESPSGGWRGTRTSTCATTRVRVAEQSCTTQGCVSY